MNIFSNPKNLSASERRRYEHLFDNEPLRSVVEEYDRSKVAKRKTLRAELDGQSVQFAKPLKAATAESVAAREALQRAEEVVAAARARHSAAQAAAYGLDTAMRLERERLEEDLRAGAPDLLIAAQRAVRAFDLKNHEPGFRPMPVSFHHRQDFASQARHEANVAAADRANWAIDTQVRSARAELDTAAAKFEAAKLDAQSEAEVAEMVSGVFRSINEALSVFRGSPRFEIGKDGDVIVKFGVDQKLFSIARDGTAERGVTK